MCQQAPKIVEPRVLNAKDAGLNESRDLGFAAGCSRRRWRGRGKHRPGLAHLAPITLYLSSQGLATLRHRRATVRNPGGLEGPSSRRHKPTSPTSCTLPTKLR